MSQEHQQISRRNFIRDLGLGALLASFAGLFWSAARALVPNVLYEAPRRFKVGLPDSFAEGVKFLPQERLFIFREGRSFYAISAVCTHLGCTVKYAALAKPRTVRSSGETRETAWEFHCPCHGSKFHGDGTNFDGPAPRPLTWHQLELSPDDGQLVVDLGREVGQNFRLTV